VKQLKPADIRAHLRRPLPALPPPDAAVELFEAAVCGQSGDDAARSMSGLPLLPLVASPGREARVVRCSPGGPGAPIPLALTYSELSLLLDTSAERKATGAGLWVGGSDRRKASSGWVHSTAKIRRLAGGPHRSSGATSGRGASS
jgi:hypothetical protein